MNFQDINQTVDPNDLETVFVKSKTVYEDPGGSVYGALEKVGVLLPTPIITKATLYDYFVMVDTFRQEDRICRALYKNAEKILIKSNSVEQLLRDTEYSSAIASIKKVATTGSYREIEYRDKLEGILINAFKTLSGLSNCLAMTIKSTRAAGYSLIPNAGLDDFIRAYYFNKVALILERDLGSHAKKVIASFTSNFRNLSVQHKNYCGPDFYYDAFSDEGFFHQMVLAHVPMQYSTQALRAVAGGFRPLLKEEKGEEFLKFAKTVELGQDSPILNLLRIFVGELILHNVMVNSIHEQVVQSWCELSCDNIGADFITEMMDSHTDSIMALLRLIKQTIGHFAQNSTFTTNHSLNNGHDIATWYSKERTKLFKVYKGLLGANAVAGAARGSFAYIPGKKFDKKFFKAFVNSNGLWSKSPHELVIRNPQAFIKDKACLTIYQRIVDLFSLEERDKTVTISYSAGDIQVNFRAPGHQGVEIVTVRCKCNSDKFSAAVITADGGLVAFELFSDNPLEQIARMVVKSNTKGKSANSHLYADAGKLRKISNGTPHLRTSKRNEALSPSVKIVVSDIVQPGDVSDALYGKLQKISSSLRGSRAG